MIKLCKNLFYKPKYGSDADSMILKHLFSTVTIVLVCLAAISFSAYAFFSYSVTSGTNTLQASNFSTTVTIKGSDGSSTQGKIQKHTFNPGTYTVTITADDGITGTGYGIVTVNGGTTYYTQQLGVDLNASDGIRTEVSFQMNVEAAAEVQFDARWGTNSYYNTSATDNAFYITGAETVIVVAAVQGVADNNEETQPKETEPEDTTGSTTEDATESQPEDATESTTSDTTVPTTDSGERVYIVQEGENLDSIAKQYGTTYSVLAAYNGIDDPRVIQPGQEIRIPPADGEMPEATEATEAALDEETQPATETTDTALQ